MSENVIYKQDVSKRNTIEEILIILKNCNFYGELVIKYEKGKIVHIKKTETIKI